METDESEEQSNNDNNLQDVVPNTNDVIDIESDASSDATYVDENDIERFIESSNSVANPVGPTGLTSNDLSQKSTSSLNSSCTSPSKKRRYCEIPFEEDDSQLCSICLDNWTTSGDHRLCSLKCGHLFGYNCVKRWIVSEAKKCCPTCKKKANVNDIRYIYARKVIAMDTTELMITKQKLENVIEDKNRVQIELSKAICRVHTLTNEVTTYKKKLDAMMYMKQAQNEQRFVDSQSSAQTIYLYKEKTMDLGRNSACRVFDCKNRLDLVAISMKSSNNLYPGFGYRIVSLTTFKPMAFITLHTQAIRDAKFHETEPWLLSCSVDKNIKILDVNSNGVITTFESNNPLWSCCWDVTNDRMLYVGQQQGTVLKFDMRVPSIPLCTMSIEGDYSPVVSVQALKLTCSETPFDAVISCKLNSAWVFETPLLNVTQEYMQCPLPLDGPFISMVYQKESDHLLISSRPTSKCPYGRHFLCVLNKRGDGINCDVVHTFRGGSTQKILSRTCFLSNKNDYVAAYVEDQRIVSLWNINTGNKVGSVPAHEPVFDLNSVHRNCDDFLLSLTESKLEIFKFTNQ